MEKTKHKIDIKERTYNFSLLVVRFISSLNLNDTSSWVITKQLVRCTTSIGANVAEAQAGSSRKDFKNFLQHALKSANETKYWLQLLKGAYSIDGKADALIKESDELSKILGKIVSTLNSKIQ